MKNIKNAFNISSFLIIFKIAQKSFKDNHRIRPVKLKNFGHL